MQRLVQKSLGECSSRIPVSRTTRKKSRGELERMFSEAFDNIFHTWKGLGIPHITQLG